MSFLYTSSREVTTNSFSLYGKGPTPDEGGEREALVSLKTRCRICVGACTSVTGTLRQLLCFTLLAPRDLLSNDVPMYGP